MAIPADGDLVPGRYLYDNDNFTTVPFTLTLNGDGWLAGASNINKVTPSGEISFASSILGIVFADACAGTNGQLLDAGSVREGFWSSFRQLVSIEHER